MISRGGQVKVSEQLDLVGMISREAVAAVGYERRLWLTSLLSMPALPPRMACVSPKGSTSSQSNVSGMWVLKACDSSTARELSWGFLGAFLCPLTRVRRQRGCGCWVGRGVS